MSIQSEIDRIKGNVSAAYQQIGRMGGESALSHNSAGLAEAIATIPSGGGPYEVTVVNGGLKATRPVRITAEVFCASEDGSAVAYYTSPPQAGFSQITLKTSGMAAVWVSNATVNTIETEFGYDAEMTDGCIVFSINGNGTITLSS